MVELIDQYFVKHLDMPAEEAARLHQEYYTNYGLAIEGLVRHHQIDPLDYNAKVDDALPLEDVIKPNPELRALLEDVDESKVTLWLLTNAYVTHGQRVVRLLGVEDLFQGLTYCDYAARPLICKPDAEMYKKAMREARVDKVQDCFFVGTSSPLAVSCAPGLTSARRLLSQLHQSQRLWLDSGPPRRGRLAGSRDASLATSDTAFARVAGHLSPILQVDACVASSIRPSGGPETRDRAAQGEGQGGHCCTRQHGTARVEGRRASGTIDIFPHVMMDESCLNPFQPATGRDASSVAEAAAIQNSTSCMTRNEERAATLKASGCCE